MKRVEMFTDGSCSGNPGAGGWGAILRYGSVQKEYSGGAPDTTNNQMELTAVIRALSELNQPCEVIATTDSKYVVDAVEKGWLKSWQQNGWRTSGKKTVANRELWEQLIPLLETHIVKFVWVKGHAGHPENERCDALATKETEKYK